MIQLCQSKLKKNHNYSRKMFGKNQKVILLAKEGENYKNEFLLNGLPKISEQVSKESQVSKFSFKSRSTVKEISLDFFMGEFIDSVE